MNRRIFIADSHTESLDRFWIIFEEHETEEETGNFDIRTFVDVDVLLKAFRETYEQGQRTPLCILDASRNSAHCLKAAERLRNIDPGVLLVLTDTARGDGAETIRRSLRENVHVARKPFDEALFRTWIDSLLTSWNERHHLQDEVQRLEMALEGANIGLWDRNVQTGEQRLNPNWAGVLGYTPEEIAPTIQAWEALIHPDDLPEVRQRIQAHFDWETPIYQVEYRVRTRSGGWKWILARGQVMEWDADGQVLRVTGTFIDISERKAFEKELKHQRGLLYSLIDAIPDLIFYKDLDGKYIGCNPAFSQFAGHPWKEIVGRSDHDIFSGQVADSFQEQDRLMLASGKSRHNEEWVDYPDGRRVLLDTMKTPFYGTEGEIVGTVGVSRDITDRKRMEDELQQAKEMAEAANQAKSEFLASMSHEIRTPMSGILGMAELLMNTDLGPDQENYLNVIQKSADSLLSIINDILDISKIEAGKIDLETIDFDLRAALEDMNDLMAIKAEEKGIEYICLIDHDVPSLLRGDPGRIRQILINLLGNALKFTHEGEVGFRVQRESDAGGQVILAFTVWDTGIGMPSDRLDLLFEKFTQLDMSTTRKYGGTGLGLTISRQLCEMMGGEMNVDSIEGEGTTFRFTLVLEKQPETERHPLPLAELEGRYILLVDDNPTNRMVLKEQLTRWDCRFAEAADGPAALDLLRKAAGENDPFHIAILDMEMPGMDGATLGMKIKADDQLRSTRLVLMTSLGQRGDLQKFASIGFSAYLVKPVQQNRLRDCLRTVLGRGSAASEGAPENIITRYTISEQRKKKARILLVEDNETLQLVTVGMLQQRGYSTDVASNGAEALQVLETVVYDLVLMDMEMPVMDGYEATRRIRASKNQNRDIPIIALTAHAMKQDLERCLNAGMNDYLAKPVRQDELIHTIETYLSRGPDAGTDEAGTGVPELPVFDKADVDDRLDSNERLIRVLLREFIQNTPSRIEGIRKAVSDGNAKDLRIQSHSLKGSAATAGAMALQDVAIRIESLARTGSLEAVPPLLDRVHDEFERLKAVLKKAGYLPEDPQ